MGTGIRKGEAGIEGVEVVVVVERDLGVRGAVFRVDVHEIGGWEGFGVRSEDEEGQGVG